MDKLNSSIFLILALAAFIQNASGSPLRYPPYNHPSQYSYADLLPFYEEVDILPTYGLPKPPCKAPPSYKPCYNRDYYIQEEILPPPYLVPEAPQVVIPAQPVPLPPPVPCPPVAPEVVIQEKPVYHKPGGATAFSTVNVFPSPPIILPEFFPYPLPTPPTPPSCPCQSPPAQTPSQIFYIQEIDVPESVKPLTQQYYY